MKKAFQRLPGLPSSGPMAKTIPSGWGHGAREGVVVAFERPDGTGWVGNFEPGLGGIDDVRAHPDGSQVLVTAKGRLYRVNPTTQEAVRLAPAVFGAWELPAPHRVLFNNQDLDFVCVGRDGVAWATPRISWDGFRHLVLDHDAIEGEAWSPVEDRWLPFRVSLADGTVVGGSYSGPDMTINHDDFEKGPVD
jgi:hypothetical protein